MLGRLATWLRILGYDAEYVRSEETALIERARETGRILLTRDTGMLRRRGLPPHLFVRSDRVSEQVRQVIGALRLTPSNASRPRCPRCNVAVEPRAKAEVAGRVPDFVWSSHDAFWGCPTCGRVYWAGSHRRRMDETIRALTAEAPISSAAAGRAMRVVFLGSPDFAVPSLDRLVSDGHTVALVVTQPDRPAGRGRALRPPSVKRAAERHGLAVLQPERLGDPDALAVLRQARPEIAVVVAYGQFLVRAMRDLPPRGCINVHASLLPKYRGAAPIHRALMAGEAETGLTVMRVEERMDAGAILLQRRCSILPEDDAGSLHDRLAALGADALSDALRILAAGGGTWTPQDDRQATLAPKLTDADCPVELSGDAVSLVNRIRALSPAPGAYLALTDGRRLRLLRADVRWAPGPSGTVLAIDDDSVTVGTGEGSLALLEVQPEGKRRMTGAEFVRGRRLHVGMRFA